MIVDTASPVGFRTFVLSNYIKALSGDLTEAALVDGCGVWRMYYQIVPPLCGRVACWPASFTSSITLFLGR